MDTLQDRVDAELDGPDYRDRLNRLTAPVADLPAPFGPAIAGGIALEERRETKERLVPLLVEAWRAATREVRWQVLANAYPHSLYTWRRVAALARAGENTDVIHGTIRQAIKGRDDARFPGLVDQLLPVLDALTDAQLLAVFSWNSPAALRWTLADLTRGVPVVRRHEKVATPADADAYLAVQRANGYILVEPNIRDLRHLAPRCVSVSVGLIDPAAAGVPSQ